MIRQEKRTGKLKERPVGFTQVIDMRVVAFTKSPEYLIRLVKVLVKGGGCLMTVREGAARRRSR